MEDNSCKVPSIRVRTAGVGGGLGLRAMGTVEDIVHRLGSCGGWAVMQDFGWVGLASAKDIDAAIGPWLEQLGGLVVGQSVDVGWRVCIKSVLVVFRAGGGRQAGKSWCDWWWRKVVR